MEQLLLTHVDKLSRTGSSRFFLPDIKARPDQQEAAKPVDIEKRDLLRRFESGYISQQDLSTPKEAKSPI